MTLNEYQTLAARTIATDDTDKMRAHALLGMASEAAELLHAFSTEEDREHIIKEAGDVAWMVAELCTALGWNLGDVVDDELGIFIASRLAPIYIEFSVGDICGTYQKTYQGHDVNLLSIECRVSDVINCLRVLAEYIDSSLDEVLTINIEKLKARYPDGFSADRSLHRADGDV